MKLTFIFKSSNSSFGLVKSFLAVLLLLSSPFVNAQQKVIRLYNGAAPGSEGWTWDEKESNQNEFNMKVVYNVSRPSLTVFLPDTLIANGTSVIICPGGAWDFLDIENGGYGVARWLNKKGVTAFVLKYRLTHSLTNDPVKESISKFPDSDKRNEVDKPIVDMAISDAKAALIYVREHAKKYGIARDRIGLMGGSSGGTVTAAIAYYHTAQNRPDFVAPLYPYIGSLIKSEVPADAPPMFIAAATDDQPGFHIPSANLYLAWVASKHSAELHIYSKGGHGFGMDKQGLPVDTWIDRFTEWLNVQGLLKPK